MALPLAVLVPGLHGEGGGIEGAEGTDVGRGQAAVRN